MAKIVSIILNRDDGTSETLSVSAAAHPFDYLLFGQALVAAQGDGSAVIVTDGQGNPITDPDHPTVAARNRLAAVADVGSSFRLLSGGLDLPSGGPCDGARFLANFEASNLVSAFQSLPKPAPSDTASGDAYMVLRRVAVHAADLNNLLGGAPIDVAAIPTWSPA